VDGRRDHQWVAASCFSTCAAGIAPDARVPSLKINVGVPVMLYF